MQKDSNRIFHLFQFRFRRERHTDVEKGESKDGESKEIQIRKLPSTDETVVARPKPSKWGRLLGKYY